MAKSSFLVEPKPLPALDIPPSDSTVSVRIIDSTSKLSAHISMVIESPMKGHDLIYSPAYSFLIEHPSGRKLLYDLGTRKDWQNFSPAVLDLLKKLDLGIEVQKNVAEILQDHHIPLADIEAVIWSHWHYDHIGDPSTFPSTTALIVGPGFKQGFLPGYPAGPDSIINESDYDGRELRELKFQDGSCIGGLQYFDYFGDGSFYILNAPGHALGHLCALARVTSKTPNREDTFIFMGGDAVHHGGEFRPTEYLPLPENIKPSPVPQHIPHVCPGAIFEELHYQRRPDRPFYRLKPGFSHDEVAVEETINHLEVFDAAENVLVVIAHDPALLSEGFPLFPADANDWKKQNFAYQLRWTFLGDFHEAVEEVKKDDDRWQRLKKA